MELNNKDRKILSLLDSNSRESISNIAKKLRLSKDGVNYRIKKLKSEGIIKRYFAEVDLSKLGIVIFKIMIQFQNVDKNKEDEIFKFLENKGKIAWIVFCSGRWDCLIGACVKDQYEFQELVDDLEEKYGEYILNKSFSATSEYYIINRKWLSAQKSVISKIGGRTSKEVDQLDIKIIKILTKNCRTPIIDIADKLKISSSSVIKRIKNLEKRKVIQNYYLSLDFEKLGMEFCKSFVYLKNYTKKEREKLQNYCLSHPNVTALTNLIGPWEMELKWR